MGVIEATSTEHAHGLSPAIVFDLRRVFSKFPEIERVLIFGSRAKGTYKDGSDIDLAVMAPTLTESRFSELWNAIDDLPILFKVDVLHCDRLQNIPLKAAAKEHGVQFFP